VSTVAPEASTLSSAVTPRSDFLLTRKLGGANRWPLFLLTSIYALNVADQYLVPTVFPLIKQEFGLSDSALGLLSGSYVIVVMVMSVPFGYFADRYHRTRIISWGTAAWGASMILTGGAWNYASLFVARMTLGAWDPCDNPTSQSLMADYYPTVQRSKVMASTRPASCWACSSSPSRRRWRPTGAGGRRSTSSPSPP
jgi:MFS family permease